MWCTGPVNSPYRIRVWRSIRSHWHALLKNSNIQVGNGRKTLFLADNCVGHGCVKDLFPDLFNISTSPNAYLSTAKGIQEWESTFRRALNDWEIEQAVEFFKSFEE